MDITVWDPRKEENYLLEDFETKRTFSSISEGLFVMEATGVDWNKKDYRSCLYSLMNDTLAENLTVIITPWCNNEFFKDKLGRFLNIEYIKPNYVAQDVDKKLFKSILDARAELRGNETGEWLFIGSGENLNLGKDELASGFSKIMDHAADFEFLIFMAEMQQAILIFKPFGKVDSMLAKINIVSNV